MPFVLDASTALSWQFEDEVSEYADRVLERLRHDQAHVPSLWPLEVANTLLVAERRGRLSPDKFPLAVQDFQNLAVSIHEVTADQALGPVLALARAHALSVYDAAYLELARREGLPLATEDDALIAAASEVGVRLVE